jgi:hypothetical protein
MPSPFVGESMRSRHLVSEFQMCSPGAVLPHTTYCPFMIGVRQNSFSVKSLSKTRSSFAADPAT